MTRSKGRRSLFEQRAETVAGRLGLAAARLAHDASVLLRETHAKSGMSSKELAAALELTEGRVSQVLRGDGNVRLSTLARFMGAMGTSLRLVAEPSTDTAPTVTSGRPGPHARQQTLIEVCYGNSEGVGTARVGVPHGRDGRPASLLWARDSKGSSFGSQAQDRWRFHEVPTGGVTHESVAPVGT
jgi:transcriptional regulator with XRE-family HTH domain